MSSNFIMSIKALKSAIKQYKKQNCKPFSKLKKDQLLFLIDELGLQNPKEAKEIARGLGFVEPINKHIPDFYGDPNIDVKLLMPTFKRKALKDYRPVSAYKNYKGACLYPKMPCMLQNLVSESMTGGDLEREQLLPELERRMREQLQVRPGYVSNVLLPQPLPVTIPGYQASGLFSNGNIRY